MRHWVELAIEIFSFHLNIIVEVWIVYKTHFKKYYREKINNVKILYRILYCIFLQYYISNVDKGVGNALSYLYYCKHFIIMYTFPNKYSEMYTLYVSLVHYVLIWTIHKMIFEDLGKHRWSYDTIIAVNLYFQELILMINNLWTSANVRRVQVRS